MKDVELKLQTIVTNCIYNVKSTFHKAALRKK